MAGDRPIFVVGFQRSGTTLLQSVLGRHPRIAAAPELHYWLRMFALREHHGDLEDDDVLHRAAVRALGVPWGLWDHVAVRPESVVARMQHQPRTYDRLFRAVMEEFADVAGRPRWAEKTPQQPVSACLTLAPDAQVVHIVRRVDDVVASSLAMPWEPDCAAGVARRWAHFNLRAVREGARLGPDSYLQLRYEDLVRAPGPLMRIVTTFLGESFDEQMLAPGRSSAVPAVAQEWQGGAEDAIRSRSGRRRLTRIERARVAASAWPAADGLGCPHRRRQRLVGRALNAALVAKRLPELRTWWRQRRAAGDPAARARLVDDLVARRWRLVEQAGAAGHDG